MRNHFRTSSSKRGGDEILLTLQRRWRSQAAGGHQHGAKLMAKLGWLSQAPGPGQLAAARQCAQGLKKRISQEGQHCRIHIFTRAVIEPSRTKFPAAHWL